MNFVERIMDLQKQQIISYKEIETLQNSLNRDGWVFCLQVHYAEPRVEVWKEYHNSDYTAIFIIKGDYVEMCSAGGYEDSWQEIEGILNECLSQGFSEKPKKKEEEG